jgi:hypothetical protein
MRWRKVWQCDVCRDLVSVEDGFLTYQRIALPGDPPQFANAHFRIVHQGRCYDYEERLRQGKSTSLASAHLRYLVGAPGIPRLLNLLMSHNGPGTTDLHLVARGDGLAHWIHLVRRFWICDYERAWRTCNSNGRTRTATLTTSSSWRCSIESRTALARNFRERLW